MLTKLEFIINYFITQKVIPTELKYDNPYQLLIAVVLSAQCLDRRVNMVTPALFNNYPDFRSLAEAEQNDIYNLIKSISYPEVKTERIINIAKTIHEQHDDIIPNSLEILTTIKGIGRKTANLVLGILYSRPGIAVDTHVARVAQRLGLTKSNNPDVIEQDLYKIFPKENWGNINPWFVIFGRYTCTAKNPQCTKCILREICCEITKKKT
ncbi:MAG: endonuclease III [Cytophagales bacterium]|nr:endonuclease III [Cytophagales bacterium]